MLSSRRQTLADGVYAATRCLDRPSLLVIDAGLASGHTPTLDVREIQ